MPDGTNKSIFSDLDKEECKEKKRTTGSKRKCTCKCLPGWKKGKSLDLDGNKITLCNQVKFYDYSEFSAVAYSRMRRPRAKSIKFLESSNPN